MTKYFNKCLSHGPGLDKIKAKGFHTNSVRGYTERNVGNKAEVLNTMKAEVA